jgi:hypothetical protein
MQQNYTVDPKTEEDRFAKEYDKTSTEMTQLPSLRFARKVPFQIRACKIAPAVEVTRLLVCVLFIWFRSFASPRIGWSFLGLHFK